MRPGNRAGQLYWKGLVLVAILCVAFVGGGCGPSFDERHAKEEAERKEMVRKSDAKLKAMSEEVSRRHDAISFPPEGIGSSAYTYELQRFFSTHGHSNVLFKGYLEDVERSDRGIVVEFLCPLGELYIVDKTAVRFRLSASEESVTQFLQVKRGDPKLRSLRYLNMPDFFVVARIDGLQKSRRYETPPLKDGREADLGPDIGLSFVSWGKLVEVVPIQSQ